MRIASCCLLPAADLIVIKLILSFEALDHYSLSSCVKGIKTGCLISVVDHIGLIMKIYPIPLVSNNVKLNSYQLKANLNCIHTSA